MITNGDTQVDGPIARLGRSQHCLKHRSATVVDCEILNEFSHLAVSSITALQSLALNTRRRKRRENQEAFLTILPVPSINAVM